VDFLFGSNCIFKKISVIDAGGFNERFRSNYEDVDICKRIKASGGDLVYLPWAKVLHLRTDTDLSVLKTKWNWNFWHYYELGAYKDIKVLAAKIIQQTQICVANVNDALSNGENGVAMLDIFNIIYTCLLDMDYAEKNELCSQSVALGFRNELLSNFKMLDKKFGGSLFDEFIKITGLNSITEFSENSNVTGSLRYALDAVIGIFNSINRNIYIALCSGIKEAAIA
jgi:hypothetical protein